MSLGVVLKINKNNEEHYFGILINFQSVCKMIFTLFSFDQREKFNINFQVVEGNSSFDNDFYTAAVVEFSPPLIAPSDAMMEGNIIEESLTTFLRLINEAAENKADIVVFPEHSLNYFDSTTRKILTKHAVELKDSEIHNSTSFDNVCDYSKSSKVLRNGAVVIVY